MHIKVCPKGKNASNASAFIILPLYNMILPQVHSKIFNPICNEVSDGVKQLGGH